jgi:TonB family protein
MERFKLIAIFFLLAAIRSGGQESISSSGQVQIDAQPTRVKVYSIEPGLTAPDLLPLNISPMPQGKCKAKVDGTVQLSILVDATGRPRNLMFLHPLGTDLDKIALGVAAADRFAPGTLDGKPVVVAASLELNLQTCVEEAKDNSGKKIFTLALRSLPMQTLGALPQAPADAIFVSADSWKDPTTGSLRFLRVGGAVKPATSLNSVAAQFSDEARRKKYQGVCLLSVIVDPQGMPQNVKVIRALGLGLDENAVVAVGKYRFKPAMRNGEPVPVMLNIAVNFRLY